MGGVYLYEMGSILYFTSMKCNLICFIKSVEWGLICLLTLALNPLYLCRISYQGGRGESSYSFNLSTQAESSSPLLDSALDNRNREYLCQRILYGSSENGQHPRHLKLRCLTQPLPARSAGSYTDRQVVQYNADRAKKVRLN